MHDESVLFLRDEKTGEAAASVLFPIQKVMTVRNSAGDVTVRGRPGLPLEAGVARDRPSRRFSDRRVDARDRCGGAPRPRDSS